MDPNLFHKCGQLVTGFQHRRVRDVGLASCFARVDCVDGSSEGCDEVSFALYRRHVGVLGQISTSAIYDLQCQHLLVVCQHLFLL